MVAIERFVLCASLVFVTSARASSCDYQDIQGTEFIFAEQPKELQHYGYQLWQKTPQPPGKLPYAEYVGKKGKFTGNVATDSSGVFKTYEAITEDCEHLYLPTLNKPIADIGMFRGIVLLSDLADAKALVGKTIFLNKTAAAVVVVTSPASQKPISVEQAEGCTVDDVRMETTPTLVLRCKSGAPGLLRYDKRYIWQKNPINPKWGAKTISLIRAQKVATGMTADQVRLAWGEPQHVNESIGGWGNHQQWVYDLNQYVYFENGRVSSIQTSH